MSGRCSGSRTGAGECPTLSDGVCYVLGVPTERVSGEMTAGELSPHWASGRRGRPPGVESSRRTRRFAVLVAGDILAADGDPAEARFSFRQHAAEARITAERALDLLGDPGFRRTVEALLVGMRAAA